MMRSGCPRLINGPIARAFVEQVLKEADQRSLLSHEHLTVADTLLEATASHESVRPKDDPSPLPSDGDANNPSIDFRGETRSNAAAQSVNDPYARLAQKTHGTASILGDLGSVLIDNRNGLIVANDVRVLGYRAERRPAVAMLTTLSRRARRRALGGDQGYDSDALVAAARACGVPSHVA